MASIYLLIASPALFILGLYVRSMVQLLRNAEWVNAGRAIRKAATLLPILSHDDNDRESVACVTTATLLSKPLSTFQFLLPLVGMSGRCSLRNLSPRLPLSRLGWSEVASA